MKKFATLFLLLCSTAQADLTNLDSFIYDSAGNAINLGQTTMSNGLPVSLASNQSAIPVSQSGTWTTGRTWTLLNTTDSVNAVQSGTWTVQQGSAPWSVSQSGTWTTGRTWTLSSGTDSATAVQGTAAASSGAWPIKLTDGTNVTAVKAASTAAVATDPSVVTAFSPNSPLPAGTAVIGALSLHQSTNVDQLNGNTINTGAGATGTGTARVAANAYDGSGNAITSASNGNAGNQLLHVQTPDTTTATTALGSLNATVTIAMAGLVSSGFQLAAGTLIGTLTPEASVDGGTTWTTAQFYNPANQSVVSSVTFGSSNTLTIYGVIGFPGISHVRVRVSAYTSGTANALLRAATVTGSSPSTVISAAFATATNTYPTVTSSATQVIGTNANRKYLLISNNSGSQMNCQFGSGTGLTTTTGFIIAAKAFYEFKGDNLFTGAMYCIGAGSIATSVTEGTP